MTSAANTSIGFSGPPTWKDALEEILPAQGSWSEEQYLVLTDGTSRLVEFTDGYLEFLPMPTDKHQSILKSLLFGFDRFITPRGGTVLFAPLRLQVRPGKYREPDLLLLLAADDERRENRFWKGADLALEVVSSEKPSRDLVDKRADYAEAGVAEYWIVDPETDSISVLRLNGDRYAEVGQFGRGDTAFSALLTGFSVDVSAILDAH